ncbi:hypothetical protein AB0B12_25480 [Streptomyces sp. NPDC044780]|uniref:hypothetical protein n=1 Tax=unclassified Streptomyces TaxID=2593676 RepID=UPI0033DFF79F
MSVPTTGVLVLEQSAEDETGANSSALQISDVTAAGLGTSGAGVLVGATASGHLGFGAAMGVLGLVAAAVCAAAAVGASRTAPRGEVPLWAEPHGPARTMRTNKRLACLVGTSLA